MSKATKMAGEPVLCQLFSLIPSQIIDEAVALYESDKYYKTMTTRKQLACLLYGVTTRVDSLQSLIKSIEFLDGKLKYIGLDKIPPITTLSDANIKRNSDVFGEIYMRLLLHYRDKLFRGETGIVVGKELDTAKVKLLDATTVTVMNELFRGAGRPPLTGKQKGGVKVHTEMPLTLRVPDVIYLSEASCNDKVFLGQLKPDPHTVYVFDKGYISYRTFQQWGLNDVYYVTRIKDNAVYEVRKVTAFSPEEYAGGGVVKDETIECPIKGEEKPLQARLVTYKDPVSGKVLQFLSNLWDCSGLTVAMLYKSRWEMEVLFKRIKGNFQLDYFYSDSMEGIKSQIWVVLIANLLFSVIHRQVLEKELYVTIVRIAAVNMGSYICLLSFLNSDTKKDGKEWPEKNRQLCIFISNAGGNFEDRGKSP